MKLSLFRAADDNRPKPMLMDWPGFVQEVLKNGHLAIPVPDHLLGAKDPEKPYKNSCPLFSPCEFREGATRSTAGAIAVHLGAVDLDHATEDILGSVLLHLSDTGLEFLLYTGWSHGLNGETSARILVPFTRPVSAREWDSFWPRMNQALGGRCDPQVKNVDRAYFLPSAPAQRHHLAQLYHQPGRPLDVDAWGAIALAPDAIVAARATRPVQKAEVEAFAKKLVKINPETGHALQAVLRGEEWAPVGHRDNVLYKLAGDIAKGFPTADPASLALVFSQSVTHYGNEFPLSLVQKKIETRQGEILVAQEAKEQESISARRLAVAECFHMTSGGKTVRDTPYTEEELATFSAQVGVSPEAFRHRWVIQKGGALYYWVAGGYVGPFSSQTDGTLAAHRYLAPATSVGIRLEELTVAGDFIQRSAPALAMDYGTPANRIVADLTAQETTFEPATATLVEAPCPLRDIEPTFNRDVQHWLTLLGGSEYRQLELWLAYVTTLELPCAALFMEGPPSCGKSLLALAIARLWTDGGPTTMKQAMGDWTDAIARCPFIFADERMPMDGRGRARTADLREFLQADVRPYSRKYVPDGTMRGAVRAMLAANNRHLLDGEDSLTPWDVAAIVGRILHIEVPSNPDGRGSPAGDFIRAMGWHPGTGMEDIIARHILWLVENVVRPPNPQRFLVQSASSKLHRAMTTTSVMGSAVAHWLVSFLLEPARLRVREVGSSAHLIRVKGGILHVNPKALTDNWDSYKTNVTPDKATAKRVMEGVAGISSTRAETRISLPVPGHPGRPKFYAIRTEDLVEWANNHGQASAEDILGALHTLEDTF